MGRKQKKYHYIYKTTNVINSKYYIGMHSTDDLNDGYIGSGKRLWHSINYHGKENHVCKILEYCQDRKELKGREEEIVNEQLLSEYLCLNLVTGGSGFMLDDHHFNCSKKGGKVFSDKLKNDKQFRLKHNKKASKRLEEWIKSGKHDFKTFKGKSHSEESKMKMSESSRGQGKGEKNSQFGSCWITNGVDNKKIKRGDEIPNEWKLGRK